MNAVGAYHAGLISVSSLRAYLACLEAKAANETETRCIKRETGKVKPEAAPSKNQLEKLLSGRCARELRQLERAGLVSVRGGDVTITDIILSTASSCSHRSAARLIPVPREMLRTLLQEPRPAVILAALVYFLYGLSFERGTGNVKRVGAIKATTIADLTGLSLRAVRSARAELIARGWITKDEASTQWKLNRTGAYFEINTSWTRKGAANCSRPELPTEPRSAPPVDNSRPAPAESAPPEAQKSTEFALPIKRPERFFQNHKDQKERTGVFENGRGGERAPNSMLSMPNIRNVRLIDLKKPDRLEALYREFVRTGKLDCSEASAINFAAAAIRAGTIPELSDQRRVRVFLGIVQRRLWANITQAEEDKALSVLRRVRQERPEFMRAA